jgi:peptidoglycan/LPS O-acetylase OafA/YrhL
MSPVAHPIRYRPEIDGLRAVAILAVIGFHLGADWLPGGFVGVDIFFVISGYLITAIILQEHSGHVFTLRNFWLRRIRRILPAMILMLAGSLVAGYFILLGTDRSSLGWQSLSALFLSANTLMWQLAGNYWAPAADKLPLLHTWSLSIEEQFYLIYPLLVMVCLRRFPKRFPLVVAVILTLSLVTCIRVTFGYSSAAFYSLSTRAWELASGCLLAGVRRRADLGAKGGPVTETSGVPSLHRSMAMLGLGLIAASFFVVHTDGFPGYKAALPVLGAMLVVWFAGGEGCPVASFLSFPIMRFIGRISYSLYLWHWPVIVFCRAAQARWEDVPPWLSLVLIPVLSVGAYYGVELPGRRLRHPLPYVLPGAGAILAAAACFALIRTHYDTSGFAPTVWLGDAYTVAPPGATTTGSWQATFEGITMTPRDVNYTNALTPWGLVRRYGGDNLDVIVFGDSHALMWSPVIDEICQESRFTVVFDAVALVDPVPAIPPKRKALAGFSPDEWVAFESNRVSVIRERHPRLIIIASRWTSSGLNSKLIPFLEEVSKINRFGNASQRSEVLFVEDPPEWALDGMNAPQFCSTTSATTRKPDRLSYQLEVASKLAAVSRKFEGVHTLETADLFTTQGGMVKIREGNAILYLDRDHLSLAGARLARERIRNAITNLIGRPPPH